MSRLRRNYTYTVGDIVSALPNWTLTCTKAGTTSADPITVQEGTIIDGTCEWNCVNNVGGGSGGVVEDWEVGKTYKVNQLVKSDNKLYICMNEHTSSEAFATDLLAGNWAFIGGAGYSNVIMDTIYEGDVQVTSTTGNDTYTLASSADNYDYAICTVKITETNGTRVKATTVVPANSAQAISWSYGIGSGNAYIATYGWVSFTTDKTSINFALRAKGSDIASVSLERVDALKVNTMTLSEIAELSMPSDVYENIPVNKSSNSIYAYTEFIAPYDGYFSIRAYSSTARSYVFMAIRNSNGKELMATMQQGGTLPDAITYIPYICVKKGDTVMVTNEKLTAISYSRLYYTVGVAKELGLMD